MGNGNSKKSRKSQVFEIVDESDNTNLEGIIPITVPDVENVPSSVTHENTVISKTEPPDPVPAETTTENENGVLAVNKTDTLNNVNEQLNDIDIDGSTPSGDGVEAEIDNTNSTANVIDTETNDKCTIPQESSETNDLKTDEEINKQDFHLESNTPEIINEPAMSNKIDEKIKVKSKEKKKSKKEKEPKMEKGSKKNEKLSRKESILSKIFSIKRKEQKDKTEVNETHSEVNYMPCHEIIDTVTVQKDTEIAADVQVVPQNVETDGKSTVDEIGVSIDTSQIYTGEKFHTTIRIIQIEYDDSSNSESKGCENVLRLESEGAVENHLVISNEPDKVHTENVTDNAKPDAVNTTIDTDKSSDAIQNYLQETFDLIDAAEIPMPSFSSQETSSTNNGCENVTLGVTTTKDEFQISSGLSPSNDLPKDAHRNDEIPKSIQSTEKTEIIRTTIGTPETIETPKSIETPEKIETLEKPEVPLAEVESKNTGDSVHNLIKKFEEQNVQKEKEKIETLDNTIDYDTINSTASTSDHITSTRDSGDSKPVVNGRVDLDVNKLYENANAQTVDINTKKETDISIATTVSVEDGNVIADNTSLEKPEENVNGTQNEALNGSSENIEINPKDQSENMTIQVSCENQIQKTNTKGNEKKKKKEKEKKGKGAKEKKKTQNEKMNEPEVPLAEVQLKNTGDAVHNSITKFEEQNVQKKKEKISPKKKKSKGATSNQSNTDYVAEENTKERKIPVTKSSSKSDEDKKAKKKKKEKKKKSSTLQNGIVISAPTLKIFQGEPVEIEIDESGMVSLSSLSSDEKEANKPTNQVKLIGIKIDSDSPTEENNLTNTSANHNLLSVDSSLATSSPKSDEYVTLFVNKDGNQSENIEVKGQLDDTVASFTQTSETSTEMAHETAQPEVDSSVEVSTVNDSNVDVAVVTVNINGELNDTSVDDAGDKNILPISPENGIAKNTISTPISDNDKTLCESPMAVENNKSKPPKKKSEKASKKKEGRPKSSLFPQSSEVSGTERNIVSRHVSFDLDPQDDTRKERPSRSFLEYLGNIFSKNSPTSESKKKNKKVTTPNKEVSTIEISQEYV